MFYEQQQIQLSQFLNNEIENNLFTNNDQSIEKIIEVKQDYKPLQLKNIKDIQISKDEKYLAVLYQDGSLALFQNQQLIQYFDDLNCYLIAINQNLLYLAVQQQVFCISFQKNDFILYPLQDLQFETQIKQIYLSQNYLGIASCNKLILQNGNEKNIINCNNFQQMMLNQDNLLYFDGFQLNQFNLLNKNQQLLSDLNDGYDQFNSKIKFDINNNIMAIALNQKLIISQNDFKKYLYIQNYFQNILDIQFYQDILAICLQNSIIIYNYNKNDNLQILNLDQENIKFLQFTIQNQIGVYSQNQIKIFQKSKKYTVSLFKGELKTQLLLFNNSPLKKLILLLLLIQRKKKLIGLDAQYNIQFLAIGRQFIISISNNNIFYIYDKYDFRIINIYCQEGYIKDLQFAKYGCDNFLIYSDEIKIYKIDRPEMIILKSIQSSHEFQQLTLSDCGHYLALSMQNGNIQITFLEYDYDFIIESQKLGLLQLLILDNTVVSAYNDKVVNIWNFYKENYQFTKSIQNLDQQIQAMSFIKDLNLIALVADTKIFIFNIDNNFQIIQICFYKFIRFIDKSENYFLLQVQNQFILYDAKNNKQKIIQFQKAFNQAKIISLNTYAIIDYKKTSNLKIYRNLNNNYLNYIILYLQKGLINFENFKDSHTNSYTFLYSFFTFLTIIVNIDWFVKNYDILNEDFYDSCMVIVIAPIFIYLIIVSFAQNRPRRGSNSASEEQGGYGGQARSPICGIIFQISLFYFGLATFLFYQQGQAPFLYKCKKCDEIIRDKEISEENKKQAKNMEQAKKKIIDSYINYHSLNPLIAFFQLNEAIYIFLFLLLQIIVKIDALHDRNHSLVVILNLIFLVNYLMNLNNLMIRYKNFRLFNIFLLFVLAIFSLNIII